MTPPSWWTNHRTRSSCSHGNSFADYYYPLDTTVRIGWIHEVLNAKLNTGFLPCSMQSNIVYTEDVSVYGECRCNVITKLPHVSFTGTWDTQTDWTQLNAWGLYDNKERSQQTQCQAILHIDIIEELEITVWLWWNVHWSQKLIVKKILLKMVGQGWTVIQ